MEHFTYFSEIEEHFQRRRGSILICSPLDWALMEVWKEAGIPLEAVLRGIDAAFDKYDRRVKKTRKVNSLAYCQQEVLAAVEELKEAAIGSTRDPKATSIANAELARYFERNAELLAGCKHPAAALRALAAEQAATLRGLAAELAPPPHSPKEGEYGPPRGLRRAGAADDGDGREAVCGAVEPCQR